MTSCKDILQDKARPGTVGHTFRTDSEGPSSPVLGAARSAALSPPSQPLTLSLRHQVNPDLYPTAKNTSTTQCACPSLPLIEAASCKERCVQQERTSAPAALGWMANALQQARSGRCHLKGLPLTPVKMARAARHPAHRRERPQRRQAASSAIPARFRLGGNLYTRTTKQYLTGLQAQTS